MRFELQTDMTGVVQGVERIEAFLHQAGCDQRCIMQFAVISEEILSNIVRDAWPGREPGFCSVEVTATPGGEAIQVSLCTEDDGIPFDPLAAPPPDLELSLEEREIGGLGIHLVRSMTDTQTYRRDNGRNIFQVTKACAAGA